MANWVSWSGDGFSYDGAIKHRRDTTNILLKHGWKKLFMRTFGQFNISDLSDAKEHVCPGDLVLMQTPVYTSDYLTEQRYIWALKSQGAKIINLIHDVDVVRFGGNIDDYRKLINQYDCLIIASQKLADYIDPKVPYVIQKPWDYLTVGQAKPDANDNIVYAGNLSANKTPFLDQIGFRVNVFGEKQNREFNSNIIWCGKYPEDELPSKLHGSFGLVWDGDAIPRENKYQIYQDYNWPSKLSLYIASGLPVIARKGSNAGKYIEECGLGYTVNSLEEIKKSDERKYSSYLENVHGVGQKMRAGGMLLEVIKKIEIHSMPASNTAL